MNLITATLPRTLAHLALGLLISTQAAGATVSWTFSGALTEVVDVGANTALAVGDTFTGRVVFDDAPPEARNLFWFGSYSWEAPFGMTVDVGDGAFVARSGTTLQQQVFNLFGRDRVLFRARTPADVDAFGTTFEAGTNGIQTLFTAQDNQWLADASPALASTDALSDATLSLSYFEALSGDTLSLAGQITAFESSVLDETVSGVPLPGSLWLLLGGGVLLLLRSRRGTSPTRPARTCAPASAIHSPA